MSETRPRGAGKAKLITSICIFIGVLILSLGVFAANNWLPRTDLLTGKRFGWFGRPLAKNAPSAWNPVPSPTPTPQLSKEYIYAGSRMLAVEDKNAVAAPPADIAVWRGSNGNWMVMGQTGSSSYTMGFGSSSLGDIPLVGDYDGDGKTDLTVYRPGTQSVFYVWPSGPTSWYGYNWGTTGDIPTVGDFDGDGKTDYVIGRPSSGAGTMTWWILYSSTMGYTSVTWGSNTDKLAPADYDGDGKTDLAVYRPGDETFYIYRSSDSVVQYADMNVVGSHVVSSD